MFKKFISPIIGINLKTSTPIIVNIIEQVRVEINHRILPEKYDTGVSDSIFETKGIIDIITIPIIKDFSDVSVNIYSVLEVIFSKIRSCKYKV